MWYRPTDLPLGDVVERGNIDAGAIFSPDERHRYSYHRRRELSLFDKIALRDHAGAIALFVLINPSKATELTADDDPTVNLCQTYTAMLGLDTTLVGNLYALRSTDPKGLWTVDDPVGPHNDTFLRAMVRRTYLSGGKIIVGWGVNPKPNRVQAFLEIVEDLRPSMPDIRLHCLLKLEDGAPAHPLVRRRIGLRDGKPLELWP